MIKRMEIGKRMSQIVIQDKTIYLAGQVALDAPGESVTKQTENVLHRIDELLRKAGVDRSRLLSATIWLADISDFDEMNAVWDAWIDPRNPPARACVEAKLATPEFKVEISIIAGFA